MDANMRNCPGRLLLPIMLLVIQLGIAQEASAGSVERWQYFCADGTIDVDVFSIYQYQWNNMQADSHAGDAWGTGFASAKTLSDALVWCKGNMRAQAINKCEQKAFAHGAAAGSWSYSTRAILYGVAWLYSTTIDDYGNIVTTYHYPGMFDPEGDEIATGSGTCAGENRHY